jgi:hypothetical protein
VEQEVLKEWEQIAAGVRKELLAAAGRVEFGNLPDLLETLHRAWELEKKITDAREEYPCPGPG